MELETNPSSFLTKTKKVIIFLFVLLNLSIMFIDGFPDRSAFGAKYMSTIARYQALSMLYQPWSMFAPNPMNTNAFVEADIYFTDNTKESWTFPKQTLFKGIGRILVGDRYRIFAQETLVSNENELIWMDVAKFVAKKTVAKELQTTKRKIREIVFNRYYNKVIPPPEADLIPHGTLSTFFYSAPVFHYLPELEKTTWN